MSCAAHGLALSRLFLTIEDVDFIAEITSLLPPNSRVIDLGAGSGTTALSVFSDRTDLRVFTIDHNAENVDWARQAITNAGFLEQWSGITMDSVKASETVIHDVDFILVDTSHEEEDTFNELSAWWPKLSTNGYMWLHDFLGDYPGVEKAVRRFIPIVRAKFIGQRGLGYAVKKL